MDEDLKTVQSCHGASWDPRREAESRAVSSIWTHGVPWVKRRPGDVTDMNYFYIHHPLKGSHYPTVNPLGWRKWARKGFSSREELQDQGHPTALPSKSPTAALFGDVVAYSCVSCPI